MSISDLFTSGTNVIDSQYLPKGVMMNVVLGGTLTLAPSSSFQKIIFDGVQYGNEDGSYDTTTGLFTPKQTGYYLLTASVLAYNVAGDPDFVVKLQQSGADIDIASLGTISATHFNDNKISKVIRVGALGNSYSIVTHTTVTTTIAGGFTNWQISYLRPL